MKDSIIKGTGNSRYLKSAISASMTFDQFKQMLIAGTLPVDLFGANADGWNQLGTALNKANLLTDATAALLGLSGDPTINAALAAIANGRAKIEFGSYVGTGVYGSGNSNSLTFGFAPRMVCINGTTAFMLAPYIWGDPHFATGEFPDSLDHAYRQIVTVSGTTMEWYTNGGNSYYQLNQSGHTYNYFAIG